MTIVAFRTDGYWTLFWLRIWLRWTSGRPMSYPPRGFVGRGFLSSAATARPKCKLLSTRLRRDRYTPTALLWRLTCVWEVEVPSSTRRRLGRSSGNVGNSWGTGGVAAFVPQISITSTSASPSTARRVIRKNTAGQ